MDTAARRAVWERAGGHCEITGIPLGDRDAGPWDRLG